MITSLQSVLGQFFIFPKPALKAIEEKCRTFKWTGKCSDGRNAPIAWEQVCAPKAFGRLGLFNMQMWNVAATGKIL